MSSQASAINRSPMFKFCTPRFNTSKLGKKDAIYTYQSCSFVKPEYRVNYDAVFGEHDMFKNLANKE